MKTLCTRPLALSAALALGSLPLQAQWSLDSLSAPRKSLASTSDGQRIYFAGGRVDDVRSDVVDVFDTVTQTWSSGPWLTVARSELAATAIGPYVLFAGGTTDPTSSTAVVDVLDTRTMTWSTTALSQARLALAATTIGTKAIFAGGSTGGPMAPAPTDRIDVYDSALGAPGDPLAWSQATLSVARAQMAPATVGTCALFAGGINVTAQNAVDIYDDSTGTWRTAQLSQARSMETHAAATAGGRAYFAGGVIGNTIPPFSNRVDVYDFASDSWSTLTLSLRRASLSAAALGDLVLFAGGIFLDSSGALDGTDVVDVLQASTGTWLPPSALSGKRFNLTPGVVGDQALFGGGDAAFTVVPTVDVFTCSAASVATFAGNGINADTIAPVAMVLGAPWSAPLTIGHGHGTGGLLRLEVRTGILNPRRSLHHVGGRSTERLISGPLLFSATGSHDGSTGDVPPLMIPLDLTLVGASWAAQYRVVGGGFIDLSQAVYGVVGCR